MPLVHLDKLSVDKRLSPLSCSIKAGELVGVIGPNGSGKSTLLRAIAGLQVFTGTLELFGQHANSLHPRRRAQKIGFLPQASQSAWSLSVQDVVSLGRLPWADCDQSAIESALEQCSLQHWKKRPVAQLSGGEQARVWLARVLAGQPQLLIADEPLASLDLLNQQKVLGLLRQQAAANRACLLSIHDLSLAARYCDKICLLNQGTLLAYGSPNEVLTEALLTQAFGLELQVNLNATPPTILPR